MVNANGSMISPALVRVMLARTSADEVRMGVHILSDYEGCGFEQVPHAIAPDAEKRPSTAGGVPIQVSTEMADGQVDFLRDGKVVESLVNLGRAA
jgi:hypothetical protein